MPDTHTLEFEVTDELADRYARTVVDRVILPRTGLLSRPTFLIVPLLLLAPLVVFGWLPPAMFAMLAVLAAGFVAVGMMRRSVCLGEARSSALAPFEGQLSRRMRVDFSEDGIRMEAPAIQSTATWKDLGEVLLWPDFWLLRLRAGGQFVVPAAAIAPELGEMIRRKAAVAGAEIREDVE
jgi:hypothetical protein